MLQLNINEVKTHLSATLSKVEQGETVIICKRNKPIAQLKPIPQNSPIRQRRAGYGRKKYPDFKLPENFNDPLPDDVLAYFTGEK